MTLKTIDEENGMKYHNLLLEWEKEFEGLGVNITLLTNDSQERLDEIKRLYHSNIVYKNGEGLQIFKDSIHDYNVYGNVYRQVRPCLWLYNEDTLVANSRRINSKSLMKIDSVIRSLKCRTQILKFLEKF